MTDDLHEFDLDAWAVPPPPDDLAAGVIERIEASRRLGAVAVEPHGPARDRRRWLIAGVGAAAITAAVVVWLVIGASSDDGPATGRLVADRARHLSLDGIAVDVDAGTELRWHRRDGAMHVEQRVGTAAWRVGDDDRLVIRSGNVSVEATGASLRMEVPMNMMDGKVIGASAVTSAVVAVVTVIVYQGHVQLSDRDRVVIVAPGATHQVRPLPEPPAPPPDPTDAVGVSAPRRASLAVLGLEVDGVTVRASVDARVISEGLRTRAKDPLSPYQLAPDSNKELIDELLLNGCDRASPACQRAIGQNLAADMLMFGTLTVTYGGYEVTLTLFDVNRTQVVRTLFDKMPYGATAADLEAWAAARYDELTDTPGGQHGTGGGRRDGTGPRTP